MKFVSTHSSDGREANGPARGAGGSDGVPFVIALVLNWNNLPDTLECVDSVRRSDYSNLAVRVVNRPFNLDAAGWYASVVRGLAGDRKDAAVVFGQPVVAREPCEGDVLG